MTERAAIQSAEKRAPLERLKSDIWLSVLAVAAVAFSHVVTGLYDRQVWIGLGTVYVIVVLGYGLARYVPIKSLPDLFWISAVAMLATWPGVPGSSYVRGAIDGVSFLPTITPLMAFAALGLGSNEVEMFKRAGLSFVLISLLVFCGTFLGSALVAHLVLTFMQVY
ncbi:MAG: hypothetical protein AAFY34_01395 [Pseudomonadota bacterium]